MTPTPAPAIQPVLQDLRRRLDALYGARLHSVVLYGSHARGEAHADSDVDVMVVLCGEVDAYAEIERLSHETYPLLLEHEALISVFLVSERAYQVRHSPLLINARREGIAV